MAYELLNGKDYIQPCRICGLVKVPACDHRTRADMERIRLEGIERRKRMAARFDPI